jgi:tryptophan 2,3-dioxygenase
MTPLQFNSFRSRLASSSGFQSGQFREFEAVLGRRDGFQIDFLDDTQRSRVTDAMQRRSLWGSTLVLLSKRGHHVSQYRLDDLTSSINAPDEHLQEVLADIYNSDPETALLLERLVDLDEGVQEWRYRHLKMVERTIGNSREPVDQTVSITWRPHCLSLFSQTCGPSEIGSNFSIDLTARSENVLYHH